MSPAWLPPVPVGEATAAALAVTRDGRALIGTSVRGDVPDTLSGRRTGPFDRIAALGDGGYVLVAERDTRAGWQVRARFGPRRWRTLATLRDRTQGPVLATGPRGTLAVVWGEQRGATCTLRALTADAGHTGRPFVVARRALCGVGNDTAELAAALDRDGRLRVAFERGAGGRYAVWLAERGRGERRLGPSAGRTALALTARAVVWSTVDGGEEVERPQVTRVAVRTRRGLRTVLVDRTPPSDAGAVAAADAPDGTTTLAWTTERRAGRLTEFPVRAATVRGGVLGPPVTLAPTGILAGVAGRTVVWTATAFDTDAVAQTPGRVEAARPGEPPVVLSDPRDDAEAVAAAADPRTGRAAVLVALDRPGRRKPLLLTRQGGPSASRPTAPRTAP